MINRCRTARLRFLVEFEDGFNQAPTHRWGWNPTMTAMSILSYQGERSSIYLRMIQTCRVFEQARQPNVVVSPRGGRGSAKDRADPGLRIGQAKLHTSVILSSSSHTLNVYAQANHNRHLRAQLPA